MLRRTVPVLLLALLVALQAPLAPAAVPALPEDDSCAPDGDASDSSADLERLDVPADCAGSVSLLDVADHYGIEAAVGKRVDIQLTATAGSYRACVFRTDNSSTGCTVVTGTTRLVLPVLETGMHRLAILRDASPTSGYRFQAAVLEAPAQDDCGSGRDAGDTSGGALAVSLPLVCPGSIVDAYDPNDWYSFEVGGGSLLRVRLASAAPLDGQLCVYRPTGALAGCSRTEVLVNGPQTGLWRASVRGLGATAGAYELAGLLDPAPPQDDCGTGGDAGATPEGAVLLPTPVSCDGSLWGGKGDSKDLFRFSVSAGDQVSLSFSSTNYLWACLREPNGNPIQCLSSGGTVEHLATVDGEHMLDVTGYTSAASTYAFRLERNVPSAPGQSDCGEPGDAGNLARWARRLSGAACEGLVGPSRDDPVDWYVLAARQGLATTVALAPLGAGDADLCIYKPDRTTLIACSTYAEGVEDTATFTAETSADHFVQVKHYSGAPAYRLSVTEQNTQDDCGSGRDAGLHEAPVRLETSVTLCHGALPVLERDATDGYVFHADAGQNLTAVVKTDPLFDLDVCFYAPEATAPTACSTNRGPVLDRLSLDAHVSGDWRLAIVRHSGTGLYDFVLSVV